MEYQYSGDGFLAEIRKYENSELVETVRIVRDGLLAVQERDGSNTVLREYTWGLNLGGGIGGLLNLKQGGQDYAYLYDGKGNVATVLDGAQAVVAAYRYDPFGKLLAQTGSLTQPFAFSTKRYDVQTGLIHYQYRSYAPAIGRWATRDPLGEAGGMNLYAFVGNNPVNWVDPWGLWSVSVTYYGFKGRPGIGLGGTITFGSKDGTSFVHFQEVGVGVGVAASLNLNGGPPDILTLDSTSKNKGFLGFSAAVSYTLGVVYGITGKLDYLAGLLLSKKDGSARPDCEYYEGPSSKSKFSHGFITGAGLSLGAGINAGWSW